MSTQLSKEDVEELLKWHPSPWRQKISCVLDANTRVVFHGRLSPDTMALVNEGRRSVWIVRGEDSRSIFGVFDTIDDAHEMTNENRVVEEFHVR